MAEEERISPAVVIVGALGLGLAGVLGLTAVAWAAPPKVYTCPHCGAEFATEEERLAHIELEHPELPPPALANLYGVVTDVETGAPLAGVSVELWGSTGVELLLHTTTANSGYYSMANILPGNYLVRFQKEGYETVTNDILLVEEDNELNVALTPIPAWATSEITVVGADLPTWCRWCWVLCSVAVTNISSSPAPCSVAIHARYRKPHYDWGTWSEVLPNHLSSYRERVSDYQAALDKYDQLTMLEATLTPGETRVFSGVVSNLISTTPLPYMQVKFVGPFGEVAYTGRIGMIEY